MEGKAVKVIAKRSDNFVSIFGICFIGFGLELLYTSRNPNKTLIVVLTTIMAIFGILWVYQLSKPKDIISLNKKERTLYLHLDDVSVKISSIKSVSTKPSLFSTSHEYWGKIILKTSSREFEYDYVKDYKKVENEIKRLIAFEEIRNEE